MKFNTKAIIGTGVFGLVLLIAGQNCQPNYVIKTSDANNQAQNTPNDPANPPPTDPPPIADFRCSRIVPIKLANPLDVPARANDGVCYSLKILDAVKNGPSAETKTKDGSILSRDHDTYAANPSHPYLMGRSVVRLLMHDRRFIKLSSSGTDLMPILVDNFLVVGTFPDNGSKTAATSFYRAYGTTDSTIFNTDHILLNDEPVVVNDFGSYGTSSITALDITNAIEPMKIYDLDVRLLDCGSIREASDVYLLFQ